jgi:hypothetical protein
MHLLKLSFNGCFDFADLDSTSDFIILYTLLQGLQYESMNAELVIESGKGVFA